MFECMQERNMANSVDLAKMVQRETCSAANRPDKGVHQAGFLVLRETSMPSCLIELGFITTPDEERLLNDKARVENIATGIYRAFVNYKNKYHNGVVVPYKPAPVPTPAVPDVVPMCTSLTTCLQRQPSLHRKLQEGWGEHRLNR